MTLAYLGLMLINSSTNNFRFKNHKQAISFFILARRNISTLPENQFLNSDERVSWKGKDLHASTLLALRSFYNSRNELEKKIFVAYEIFSEKVPYIARDNHKSVKFIERIIRRNTKDLINELQRFDLIQDKK